MELRKIIGRSLLIWCGLFVLGLLVGSLAYKTILPRILPVLNLGFQTAGEVNSLGGFKTVFLIFLKNALVLLLCVLLGSTTRGVFPAAVCFLNGGVLGLIGAVFARYGNVAWWKYTLVLAPHGVIEIASIFLGCVIGVMAITRKERLSLAKYPLAMLAVAACIETWVSTIIANRII